jgi:uncharacterized protein
LQRNDFWIGVWGPSDTMFELRRHNDILAIKTDDGRYVGFHARNLEVASLSEDLWQSTDIKLEAKIEAQEALMAWDQEEAAEQAESNPPVFNSFTINVNQICNLHCQYCAAGGDGSYGDPVKKISVEKTLPQLKYFIEKIPAGDTLKINFVGGEPLLYAEGIDLIYDYLAPVCEAKGLQLRIKIVTNGTQFTDTNLAILKKVRPYLVVSLDGPAEINDQRRPSKGGLGTTAKVLAGLEKLRSIQEHLEHLEISGVFGPGNLDLQKAYEFYKGLGADSFDFTFDHHCHDKKVSQEFISQYASLLEKMYALGGESEVRKITAMETFFGNLDEQKRVTNFCGAGKSFLVIDAKNNLYTCPWDTADKDEMVGTMTHLFEEKIQKYQAPLVEKAECRSCWARFLCGGGCMYIHKNSTGFKNKVDEMFCFRQRNLISLAIIYYERSRNYKELSHATH